MIVIGQIPFSEDDDRKFHAGLAVGADFCQVDGDGFSGYHKIGIAGNAMVFMHLKGIFHASLGLGYAQKGSRAAEIRETYTGPAIFRYSLDLNYAEMPLLVHMIAGRGLNYSAGISYARLISSKEESEDINPIRINPELYPFRKSDWFGIFGIGLHISKRFFLSGQYQYTIGSIRSEPYIPPGYGYGRQRNNVMTLRLLYVIPSGR